MINFLIKFTMFIFLLASLLVVILGSMIIIQAEIKELLGLDVFIRIREWAKTNLSPKMKETFFDDKGTLYISVPKDILERAEVKKVLNEDSEGWV